MRAGLAIAILAATALRPSFAQAEGYAPIDCAKARSPSEQTICRNYALGQQEARLATLFGVATSLVAMGQRGDIQDAQRAWLKTREACANDVACLARAYDARIAVLNGVVDGIAKRGPF